MAPAPTPRRPWFGLRAEALAVLGLLVAAAVAGLVFASRLGPLGWDESVYASQARSYVTGIPFDWFLFYRPPGLAVLGVLAAPMSFDDLALRGIAVALGVGALGLAWAVTRQAFGRAAGLLALVAICGMPLVLREIGQFHNDLASAGLLLLLMLVLWDQFERRQHASPMLLLAGAVAAAAFYLRFGTLPALVAISLTSALLWRQRMWRDRRLVAGTIALALVLVVPHIVSAVEITGSPIGILRGAVEITNTSDPVSSLRRYLGWLPRTLAGIASTILIALGLLHVVVLAVLALHERRVRPELRRLAWLLLPAAITAGIVIAVSHPEQRYIIFPAFLATSAGAGSASVIARSLLGRIRLARVNVGRVALAGMLLVLAASSGYELRRAIVLSARPQSADLEIAGRTVREDAGGRCRLVSTLPPILGWYSHCQTVQFLPGALDVPDGADMPVYIVFTDIDDRRARDEMLDPYRAMVNDGRLRHVGTTPEGRADIYRVVR